VYAGGHSVCWLIFRCWWTRRSLEDTRFASGHSVCWWTVRSLVDTRFAGGYLVAGGYSGL
jgi:hypothetical protein